MTKCEICGKEFITSCLACTKRVITWGEDGAVALRELATRNEITGAELMEFVGNYYKGQSTSRSSKAHTLKTALRLVGFTGKITSRIHRNGTTYAQIRKRENTAGRRWRLKLDSCQKCGSTDNLHLHHMVPLSWGGISSEDNCITLCESCHRKAHRQTAKYLSREKLLEYLAPHKDEIKSLVKIALSEQ